MIKNIIIVILVVAVVYLYIQTAAGQKELAAVKGKLPNIPALQPAK